MKPILPWLFVCFAVLAGLYIAWSSYPWWGERAEKFDIWGPAIAWVLLVGVCSLGAAGVGVGISSYLGGKATQVWDEYYRAPMVSMRSADGISGSISGGIFIVSGQIGSNQVYHYYTAGANGAFKPHKWEVDGDTSIFEEERENAEVVQFTSRFKHAWMEWLGYTSDRVRMDFHIPKGSLKQGFSLQ